MQCSFNTCLFSEVINMKHALIEFNAMIEQSVAVSLVALRINITLQTGSDMRDLFASLFYQMRRSYITALGVVDNYNRIISFLLHAVEEYYGNTFFYERLEMIHVVSIKSQRSDQSIH